MSPTDGSPYGGVELDSSLRSVNSSANSLNSSHYAEVDHAPSIAGLHTVYEYAEGGVYGIDAGYLDAARSVFNRTNPDILLRNPDFRLNTVDFIMKHRKAGVVIVEGVYRQGPLPTVMSCASQEDSLASIASMPTSSAPDVSVGSYTSNQGPIKVRFTYISD